MRVDEYTNTVFRMTRYRGVAFEAAVAEGVEGVAKVWGVTFRVQSSTGEAWGIRGRASIDMEE